MLTTDPTINSIVTSVVDKYQPQKIILFGSQAGGQPHKWSDVDLVVIKDTNKRFYDRIGEVSALVEHTVPIDFFVYTPDEFNRMATHNNFIQTEVINKGQVLYEQPTH